MMETEVFIVGISPDLEMLRRELPLGYNKARQFLAALIYVSEDMHPFSKGTMMIHMAGWNIMDVLNQMGDVEWNRLVEVCGWSREELRRRSQEQMSKRRSVDKSVDDDPPPF